MAQPQHQGANDPPKGKAAPCGAPVWARPRQDGPSEDGGHDGEGGRVKVIAGSPSGAGGRVESQCVDGADGWLRSRPPSEGR